MHTTVTDTIEKSISLTEHPDEIRAFVKGFRDKYRPGPLTLDINEQCGRHCRHCTFQGWQSHDPLLRLDGWKKVLQEGKDFGVRVVAIVGREPFLPRTLDLLVPLLREAHRLEFEVVGLVSDAFFVPRGVETLVQSQLRLSYLDISVDGLQDTHEFIRGEGAWQHVKKAFDLELLSEVTRAVGISTTLTHLLLGDSSQEFLELLRWAAQRGVRYANVSAMYPARGTDPELFLNPGDFEHALNLASLFLREHPDFRIVFDLPPRAVPDVCDLARRGIVRFDKPVLDRSRSIFIWTRTGLRIRVYGGLLGLGTVLRVTATGQIRLEYDASETPPPSRTYGSILEKRLDEIVLDALFGPGGLWERRLQEALSLPEEILNCPAWPYCLSQCEASQH